MFHRRAGGWARTFWACSLLQHPDLQLNGELLPAVLVQLDPSVAKGAACRTQILKDTLF